MAENLTCSKETYGETKRLIWVISWPCIVPGLRGEMSLLIEKRAMEMFLIFAAYYLFFVIV